MDSYLPPSAPLPDIPSVHPRKWSNFNPPLHSTVQPANLSSRPPQFTKTHTLSTHIFPAAFPRMPAPRRGITVPENFGSKEERRAWVRDAAETLIKEKRSIEKGVYVCTPEDEQVGLWMVVNRICRKEPCEGGKQSITLIAMHPIGFHKETWEEAFRNIIELTEVWSSPIRIEEIWSLEDVHHGDTGLLNAENLPRLSDRADYGKDIATFCLYYLPEDPRTPLPNQQLPLLDKNIYRTRQRTGYSNRTLVGLGHSLGGDALALAAIHFPALFCACVLLETTIFPSTSNAHERSLAAVAGALGRRSSWASRAEAREAFLKTPLFQTFHPAVLDAYIDYGLYDHPDGAVYLKTSPPMEASEFTENRTNNETWEMLPTLDERIPLLWILGGNKDASHLVGGEHVTQRTVWRRPVNCANVKIPGAGHLVVQQKPLLVASHIVKFLNEKCTPLARKEANDKIKSNSTNAGAGENGDRPQRRARL